METLYETTRVYSAYYEYTSTLIVVIDKGNGRAFINTNTDTSAVILFLLFLYFG